MQTALHTDGVREWRLGCCLFGMNQDNDTNDGISLQCTYNKKLPPLLKGISLVKQQKLIFIKS